MMRKAPRLTRRNSNTGSTFANNNTSNINNNGGIILDAGDGVISRGAITTNSPTRKNNLASSSLSSLSPSRAASSSTNTKWYQHSAAALEASFQSARHASASNKKLQSNKNKQGLFHTSTNRCYRRFLLIFFISMTCLLVFTYVSMFRQIMKNHKITPFFSSTTDLTGHQVQRRIHDTPDDPKEESNNNNNPLRFGRQGSKGNEQPTQIDYLNNETNKITMGDTTAILSKTLNEDLSVGSELDTIAEDSTILDLTPLRTPVDYQYYTVRINTFRRNEQLLISVNHWSTCDGVKQIQVIWCDSENDPPKELVEHPSGKVVIERHSINSLNERFNIINPNELLTYGILSVDDDVIRPCQAADSGFFRWTRNPHRIVGYDTRVHTIQESSVDNSNVEGTTTAAATTTWGYGALSISQKTHKYSMVLTRFCFIHKDYLDIYYNTLPSDIILDPITEYLNCEDIAMTLLVSNRTLGKPPLLANAWARKTQIKLYQNNPISGGEDNIEKQEEHRRIRNKCMDTFATYFYLKPSPSSSQSVMSMSDNNKNDKQDGLTISQLKNGTKLLNSPQQKKKEKHSIHHNLISYNWVEWDKSMKPYFSDEYLFDDKDEVEDLQCQREVSLSNEWNLHYQKKNTSKLIKTWIDNAKHEAKNKGLIQNTKEWKQRFGGTTTS